MIINIEEIKKFNRELEEEKKAGAECRAQYNFNLKEIQTLCEELTRELGVEITPENIREKRDEYMQKVQTTLQNGNDILRRIQEEKTGAVVQPQVQPQIQPQIQPQVQPQMQYQTQVQAQPSPQQQAESIFESTTTLNIDGGLIDL